MLAVRLLIGVADAGTYAGGSRKWRRRMRPYVANLTSPHFRIVPKDRMTREERSHAAPPSSGNKQLVAVILVLGALLAVYWSVIAGLVNAWSTDDNYSHGFFIVPLALYFAWERRERILAAPITPSFFGLIVVAGSLFLLIAGLLGAELFLSRVSIIGAIGGAILFLYGWPMMRILIFPLAFMLLMIPLPAIIFNKIAFPLQLLASHVGESTISAMNIPILREGNVLILANATLEVAEACSGIRSLVALAGLVVIYVYFTEARWWRRVVLLTAVIPIAVLANAARVAGTGLLAHYRGVQAAEGFLHNFSGLLIFLVAVLLLLALAKALDLIERVWRRPGLRDAAGEA